jgi:hypothetical protein
MGKCQYCGSLILFGGVKQGPYTFCNAACAKRGVLLSLSSQIPEEALNAETRAVHHGPCPRCHGPGPVDVQTSYRVWSALVVTSWESIPTVCCGACGFRAALSNTIFCAALGWWGIPWGLLMTPVQLTRNILAMNHSPHPHEPSVHLRRLVGLSMAAHAVQASQPRQGAA